MDGSEKKEDKMAPHCFIPFQIYKERKGRYLEEWNNPGYAEVIWSAKRTNLLFGGLFQVVKYRGSPLHFSVLKLLRRTGGFGCSAWPIHGRYMGKIHPPSIYFPSLILPGSHWLTTEFFSGTLNSCTNHSWRKNYKEKKTEETILSQFVTT